MPPVPAIAARCCITVHCPPLRAVGLTPPTQPRAAFRVQARAVDLTQPRAPDDRTRFLPEAKAAVAQLCGYGHVAPLLVATNAYGRDLPAALNYGSEIVASDPVHNIVISWDAY